MRRTTTVAAALVVAMGALHALALNETPPDTGIKALQSPTDLPPSGQDST